MSEPTPVVIIEVVTYPATKSKLTVIRAIRQLTGWDLAHAKHFVEHLPGLLPDLPRVDLPAIKQVLDDDGIVYTVDPPVKDCGCGSRERPTTADRCPDCGRRRYSKIAAIARHMQQQAEA